ncbi:hypothetical protein [Dactylosporangium matsuzakiense]|uniref:Uncharacterized protein n=1 Tax=Dactylosporangium matsuzakiense TaxID=53360 RepID=A0A9W6NNS8_9ACTN|nr:hypothetical protein [Dactylosporangium matsuzakiense]GLL03719.1 hypothetical protein GCM10017581_054650 [Dactylosporangium matsuzakiense]
MRRHQYRHAFTYLPYHPGYAAAWPGLHHDIVRILGHVQAAGVVLTGPDGGPPFADPDDGIAFNGDARRRLDAATFTLGPPWTPTTTRRYGRAPRSICRTDRHPYDVAVCAVLLRCLIVLPGLCTVTSDGAWDGEWAAGAGHHIRSGAAGAAPLSARGVVADLFGTTSVPSLLSPGRVRW